MWKSVRLRVRDLNGEVNLDSNERPVDGRGDNEAVEVAFAHMLEWSGMLFAKG